jgi:hypothetical protein
LEIKIDTTSTSLGSEYDKKSKRWLLAVECEGKVAEQGKGSTVPNWTLYKFNVLV